MAKSKKNASGRWAVQIQIAGVRESGTFDTKREADAWASRRSLELKDGKSAGDKDTRKTLRDALQRYAKEVSPTKKGWRWEILRLAAFEQSDHALLPLAKRIDIVAASDLGRWRDYRLLSVSRGTVLREMGLLSAVLECARREWGWCKINALHDVRKPAQPDHRERIISGVEIRKMLRQLGWPQKLWHLILRYSSRCATALLVRLSCCHPVFNILHFIKTSQLQNMQIAKSFQNIHFIEIQFNG